MTSVPSSHKVGGGMYGSVTSLRGIMAALHERSAAVKTEIGQGDCPVFSTSCKHEIPRPVPRPLSLSPVFVTYVVQVDAGSAAAF